MFGEWIVRRVTSRRPAAVAIGGEEDPYLLRWFVLPRNRFLNVYLHRFLRDDDPRALHDHPWLFNISLLLAGGSYGEVAFVRSPVAGSPLPSTVVRNRRSGRPVLRLGSSPHRVVLTRAEDGDERGEPCWSLFVTGPVVRSWGFWCPFGRWVHWKRYTSGYGVTGLGCDAE